MTPAELAKIRGIVDHRFDLLNYEARALLAHIDQLTRQLEDARDIATRAGAFTTPWDAVSQCWDCGALDVGNPCETCEPAEATA